MYITTRLPEFQPPWNEPLRRYLSMKKFRRLLDGPAPELWFATLKSMEHLELGDRREGHLPPRIARDWDQWWRSIRLPEIESASAVGKISLKYRSHEHRQLRQIRAASMTKQARNGLLVSCWHQGWIESQRMWSDYADGGKGVAIISTPERVASALDIWKNDDEMAWFC
ncbi:MAG: hypothetical protein FJ037_06700 [Chloroflexi bacterium]|nr:hypothetical protein [Chloroflexota bacterium]